MKFACSHINDLQEVSEYILSLEQNVFLLFGQLGAGKTTLMHQIAADLGVKDEVSSPTYALVNEYSGKTSDIIHMDLYRLESLEEAIDIGVEDYLYQDSYVFIEWPQIISSILPSSYVKIEILVEPDETRIINISSFK